jgi:serine/threonine-protein kinase HipA
MISGASDLPEGYRHFLVKFPAKEDREDIGAVEAAYALMAVEAGVEMPPTRLFETRDGRR